MRYSVRTISYFITWGICYGTVLGGISGTVIFPAFGTMYAIPWGLGMGAALGVVMGILTAVINALNFKPDTNITAYRRSLSAGIGTLTAIGASLLLIITTRGFLWEDAGGYGSDMAIWLVLSLIAAIFWGGLSSAFAASRFVDWYAGLMTKRKNDEGQDDTLNEIEHQGGGVWSYLKRVFRNWWIPFFGAAAVSIIHTLNGIYWMGQPGREVEAWVRLVSGVIGGFVYSGALMAFLGFHTGFLLHVLNRLLFREYFPNASFNAYRASITVLAALFTTLTSVMVTAGIGAIPAGIIAGGIAWRYANWYIAEPEKDKRKAQESVIRLMDNMPEENFDSDADEVVYPMKQSQ